MCDKDVFDEDDPSDLDIKLTNNEYEKLMEHTEKAGFRDGIDAGKERVSQDAFDSGFNRIFEASFAVSQLRGIVEVLSIEAKNKSNSNSIEESKKIKSRLGLLKDEIERFVSEKVNSVSNESNLEREKSSKTIELPQELIDKFINLKHDCMSLSSSISDTLDLSYIEECNLNRTIPS